MLKLQYFGHLMLRADSLEMTLMLGNIESRRRSGGHRQHACESRGRKRSKQSILKEISPQYSLQGLMLKLQYFGHLM